MAWPLLFSWAMQIENQVGVPAGDHPLAEVTFRLCRLLLARKVLWDDDAGLDVARLAEALNTTISRVIEVVTALCREGWVVLGTDGASPSLTTAGMSAILGRDRSAEPVHQRDPHRARPASVSTADDGAR